MKKPDDVLVLRQIHLVRALIVVTILGLVPSLLLPWATLTGDEAGRVGLFEMARLMVENDVMSDNEALKVMAVVGFIGLQVCLVVLAIAASAMWQGWMGKRKVSVVRTVSVLTALGGCVPALMIADALASSGGVTVGPGGPFFVIGLIACLFLSWNVHVGPVTSRPTIGP
ncbi:hypothetical protein [Ruania alba]|uniref:Uncharacterized protein n=1 Tax=Ruania alba TaxID=648782 RepID=A0A1H5N832_9MICO|nr:hypothetical protein [Ruania alba]SEE97037.1 hypothetical protein SAMN04488554_3983 [Ruania alba]